LERLLEGLARDVRVGIRAMARSPGLSLAAVLTLGLGTGAATAVFSLVDGVVLRPLPYPEPERLVSLRETRLEQGLDREPLSPVNFLDYRSMGGVFEDAAAWWRPEVNLSDEAGDPIRVSTVEASENLFAVLGVEAVIGRTFPIDSTLFGEDLEVVISHRLWRSRFGADPAVLGRTVRLNGTPYEIVGVLEPGFHHPDDTDVWQRLRWDLSQHSRGAHFMGSVARLNPGVTVRAANARLEVLTSRLGEEHPGTNAGWSVRALPLGAEIAGAFRPGLLALLAAAGLLLVIACINVANLLLARGMSRRAEIAVRAALGANRRRLLSQLLIESGMLALAGAAVGFVTALAGLRAFLAWTPIDIPRAGEVAVNPAVLGFAILVAVLTALIFGLAPALALSRTRLHDSLREGGRGGGTGGSGGRGRNALVVAEVALAVVLLAGAGLLIRSVVGMLNVDAGVRSEDVVTANVQLPGAQFTWDDVSAFYAELVTNLNANPAIAAAGLSNVRPLEPGWRVTFGVDGGTTTVGEAPIGQYQTVDEGWFDALGIRPLSGRTFARTDDAENPPVVIINEALARRHWPDGSAVGRHVTITVNGIGPLGLRLTSASSESLEHEIVGVVSNVRNASLGNAPEPTIYFTQRQFPFRNMFIFARGPAGAQDVLGAIRREVALLDPTLPLAQASSLDRLLAAPADPPRLVMLVLAVFAALALSLAAIGVYGILSYLVTTRRREIGIRMALGAQPGMVMWMVLRQGVVLGVAGIAIGGVGAALSGRLLSSLLFDVQPADPVTLVMVTVAALAVTIAACLVPGRRAAATQPMRSLRNE
jgi:predicted permease